MIVVKLIGGLGNQMFQYAFGRKLSILNNTTLKLDATDLMDRSHREDFTYRDYRLGFFNIDGQLVTPKERAIYFPRNSYTIRFKKFICMKLGIIREITENETNARFDSRYLLKAKNGYACGYWQSEAYFNDIRPLLMAELTVKNEHLAGYAGIVSDILSKNSVSIHIRRGDYVTNPVTNSFHGVCSLDYYCNAIAYMKKIIPNPHFFIFSDEMDWVKEYVNFDAPYTMVEANPDYIDLHLMSHCKHHIIANSSFSWWGAWLNPNPEKIVVAPKQWFKAEHMSSADLIPESWVTL